MVMGSIAASGSQIYPNIEVNSISVGGMTESEAAESLANATENHSDKSITINFPNNESAEISSTDVGLIPTADEAAKLAYNYGRTGNIFTNSIKYFQCLIGMGYVNINSEVGLTLDEDMLHSAVENIASSYSSEPAEPSYEIVDDILYITKGASGMIIDDAELYEILAAAFLASDFKAIDYDAQLTEPAEIDLQAIYDSVYTEPQNSIYDKSTGSITQDVDGVSFNKEEAEKSLLYASGGETVEIALEYTEADVTKDSLDNLLFSSMLASKSTSLTNNSNRNNNIELAADAINGTVINSGEQFSFNDIVGQRTESKGYLAAGAYSSGQSVTEVGGGICQVSSTIYYCVLMSDLEVVSRKEHSLTVSYLPLGMDATVSWGGPEFIFANDTNYPIKVLAWRDGLELHVEIYGTKTNDYTYKLDSVTTSTVNYETEYVNDSSLASGTTSVKSSGRPGYTVDTYRYVYDSSGNLIREEKVNTSSYSKQNQVVLRGTG